jgi:hypothetical protein
MQTRAIVLNGTRVLVEVDDLDSTVVQTLAESQPSHKGGHERGVDVTRTRADAADKLLDAGAQLRSTLAAVVESVEGALRGMSPAEWALEVQLGFKGEAGVPCLVKGEVNGSLKVTVKWKGSGHAGDD